jgi:hypothetical protein
MARAGARESPSVTSKDRGFIEEVLAGGFSTVVTTVDGMPGPSGTIGPWLSRG